MRDFNLPRVAVLVPQALIVTEVDGVNYNLVVCIAHKPAKQTSSRMTTCVQHVNRGGSCKGGNSREGSTEEKSTAEKAAAV